MTNKVPSTGIVIATTDPKSRANLRGALRQEPGFRIVGEASNERGLLALRKKLQPDILLLDSALAARCNGTVSSWPSIHIILLATTIDDGVVTQAVRLAARGIVPKTASPQTLLDSIRGVLAGQYWMGPDCIAVLVGMLRCHLTESSEEPHESGELSIRELEVVSMIAGGHSNKQISQKLAISERTVKHHLTRIFGKLGVSSRLQLANFAVTRRLATTTAGGVTAAGAS